MHQLAAKFPLAWFAQATSKNEQMFLLLDAAIDKNIPNIITEFDSKSKYLPLFYQEKHIELLDASPILVPVIENSPLVKWALESEKISKSCIFLSSMHAIEHIADYFIKYLDIVSDEGEYLLFRFYDPVVMSDMIFSDLPNDLDRILFPIASLALNFYDKNNQNIWGAFYKKYSANQGEPTNDPIIYGENYIELFQRASVRRKINKHIIESNKLLGNDMIVKSNIEPVLCQNFDTNMSYAEKSIYIDNEVYDEALKRLMRYESLYEITNFNYLAKCDTLLSLADPISKLDMHKVLIDKQKVIVDKIYLCEKILEIQYV